MKIGQNVHFDPNFWQNCWHWPVCLSGKYGKDPNFWPKRYRIDFSAQNKPTRPFRGWVPPGFWTCSVTYHWLFFRDSDALMFSIRRAEASAPFHCFILNCFMMFLAQNCLCYHFVRCWACLINSSLPSRLWNTHWYPLARESRTGARGGPTLFHCFILNCFMTFLAQNYLCYHFVRCWAMGVACLINSSLPSRL